MCESWLSPLAAIFRAPSIWSGIWCHSHIGYPDRIKESRADIMSRSQRGAIKHGNHLPGHAHLIPTGSRCENMKLGPNRHNVGFDPLYMHALHLAA